MDGFTKPFQPICYSKWKYSKGKITWKNKDWGELYVKDSLLPRSMENLAIPAKKFSASIREIMESGTFFCPKKWITMLLVLDKTMVDIILRFIGTLCLLYFTLVPLLPRLICQPQIKLR